MNAKNLGILFLLAALWGASFLFIRVAAPMLSPYMLVELRVGIAAIALILYSVLLKKRITIWHNWKKYIILGALNAAIPFVFISYAEVYIPASLAAILNATTPLFNAIIAWVWIKEPMNVKKVVGLITGFFGVIVLVGWTPVQTSWSFITAILCSLIAAIFYGFGTIYAKQNFQATPLELSIGQLAGASLSLIPVAVTQIPSTMPSVSVILAVLALALVSTAFAYLLYFHLLTNVGPTQTLYVTFLVPVFGVIWGTIFLHEIIGIGTLVGLAMIFLSIGLLTNIRLMKRHIVTEMKNEL